MQYEKTNLTFYMDVNSMRKEYRSLEEKYHKLMDYMATYPMSNSICICPICQSYMPVDRTCGKCGHMYNSSIPYAVLDPATAEFKHNKRCVIDIMAYNYEDIIQKINWGLVEDVYTVLCKNTCDSSTMLSCEVLQKQLKYIFDSWTPETSKVSQAGWTITKVNDMYSVTFVVDSSHYYFYK